MPNPAVCTQYSVFITQSKDPQIILQNPPSKCAVVLLTVCHCAPLLTSILLLFSYQHRPHPNNQLQHFPVSTENLKAHTLLTLTQFNSHIYKKSERAQKERIALLQKKGFALFQKELLPNHAYPKTFKPNTHIVNVIKQNQRTSKT